MFYDKYQRYKNMYINEKGYINKNGGNSKLDRATELKQNYIKHVIRGTGKIRLATYNVHYFTDTYDNENTYSRIINNILLINADIIILQEALVGGDKTVVNDKVEINLSNLYDDLKKIGYRKVIFCNTTPSWFNAAYGNLLLVHDRVTKDCKSLTCEALSETNVTFPKSTTKTIVSGAHEGTLETRCFIYIRYSVNGNNIHVYGTHLDVGSESTRMEQINKIIEDAAQYNKSNDVVFVMGDFNSFNSKDKEYGMAEDIWNTPYTRDNGAVVEALETNGFIDLELNQTIKSKNEVEMTTWNNTRVDFIFCNKLPSDYIIEHLYDDASDHIPVIVTMSHNSRFNVAR